MVMLTRGGQRIVAALTALTALGRFVSGVLAAHEPHDDETVESERAAAIYAQIAGQAPPPAPSMPMGHRFVATEPQRLRHVNSDDSWMLGSPRVLLDSVAPRG